MKKLFYTLASLAVIAGCAKEEAPVQAPSEKTIDLTLTVDKNATKTTFDGDSHIRWESTDAIAVMIDTKEGSQSHSGAYRYSEFKIGEDLENPQFKGKMTWMDDQAQEQMWVYGFYPFSAMATATDCAIHGKKVILPASQTFSSASWDGKADIMAIEPVQLTGTPAGTPGYYEWQSDLTIKFAHVFGFGNIKFGDLSACEAKGETVKKVMITATNAEAASHPLTGMFMLNLESDVTLAENAPVYSANANNTLSLVPSEEMTLEDADIWFVANPGTYDVTIEVVTSAHKLTFLRSGLVITRSRITSPVINLKPSDTIASTDVVINGSWKHNATDAYAQSTNTMFFKNGVSTVDWGTSDATKKMEMNLNYVGASSSYYGTPQSKNGIYSQDFNYSAGRSLSGIAIQVASSYQFDGMKTIKVKAGIYNQSSSTTYTGAISVFVDGPDGKTQVGEAQTMVGSTASREGTDFFFAVPEALAKGQLIIEMANFSYNYCAPYISELEINPKPGIVLGSTSAAYMASASNGSFDCEVISATSNPTISSDAEWIHPTYADGVVSYTVDANTTTENRTGVITVSASNENGTSTADFTISQLGSQYKEYTLTLSYNDIKNALLSAGADDLAADKITTSTYYTFDITANAVAADNTTFPVTVSCQNVLYKYSVDNEAIAVYGGSTYGRLVNATPVYAISDIQVEVADGQSAPLTKVGTTSSNLSEITMSNVEGNIYAGSADMMANNAYLQIGAGSWTYKYHYMKDITISFINE